MTWLTPWRRQSTLPAEFSLFDQWMRDWVDGNGRQTALLETPHVPRADVHETDKDYVVTLELPGMTENEVDVRLVGNELVISGERKQKEEKKDQEKHWHRVETVYGAFERRFELPMEVRKDPESVEATFSKGLLEVRIPKAEVRPAARIPVKKA